MRLSRWINVVATKVEQHAYHVNEVYPPPPVISFGRFTLKTGTYHREFHGPTNPIYQTHLLPIIRDYHFAFYLRQ